jgi:hypothetical protein
MHARWGIAAGLLLTVVAVGSASASAGATELPGNPELGGYQVAAPSPGSQGRTSIQAQITVPSIACTSADGVVDATAEIVGTNETVVAASILGTCSGGTPSYHAEGLGIPLSMTITPGDKVVIRAFTLSSPGSTPGWGAMIDDRTTGVSLLEHGATETSLTAGTVSLGVVSDDTGQTIPDFGKLHWSNALYNNQGHVNPPLGSADPQGYALIKNPNHPKLLVSTSTLSPAGESFTTTWDRGS